MSTTAASIPPVLRDAPTSPVPADPLQAARDRIDQIDADIQKLLDQRARWVQTIGQVKGVGLPVHAYYRPEREQAVLDTVRRRNPPGLLLDNELEAIFRAIMEGCLRLQLRQGRAGPQARLPVDQHPV